LNLSELAVFEFSEGRDNQRETEYSLHVRWRIAWIPGAGQIISIDGEDFKALFGLRWKFASYRYYCLLLFYKRFFNFVPFVSADELFLNVNCRAFD
jgi:hypothetical protein